MYVQCDLNWLRSLGFVELNGRHREFYIFSIYDRDLSVNE